MTLGYLWVIATWAIAVWGGVLGAVLLLRRRLAVPVFLASLVAMVLTTVHNYVLSNGLDIFQDAGSRALTGVSFVIALALALALYLYARTAAKQGVLV